MSPITLDVFLETVDSLDRADAEHAALTSAVNTLYDLLDDQGKHDAQRAFPLILRNAKNVAY